MDFNANSSNSFVAEREPKIEVSAGANTYPFEGNEFVGITPHQLYRMLGDVVNAPANPDTYITHSGDVASALVNSETYIIRPGDHVEFRKDQGEKGLI